MKQIVSLFLSVTNLYDGCGVTFDVTSNSQDEFLTDICIPYRVRDVLLKVSEVTEQ